MVKVFSIGFFCLCLILAVIPWLIKAEKPAKTVQKPKEEVAKTIPDIESLWQNAQPQTPAANTTPKPETSPKIVKTTEPPKPKTQTTSTTQKPAAAAKTQPKPVSKTTSAASKPVKKDPPVQPAVQPKPKLPQSVLNTVQKTTSTGQKRRTAQNAPFRIFELQRRNQERAPCKTKRCCSSRLRRLCG